MCQAAPTIDIIEYSERVRIVRFTLAPGAETGWHKHTLDYVIVPYGDCRIRVDLKDQSVEAEMKKSAPYFRKAGVEHNVVSLMAEPMSFLEIELK